MGNNRVTGKGWKRKEGGQEEHNAVKRGIKVRLMTVDRSVDGKTEDGWLG